MCGKCVDFVRTLSLPPPPDASPPVVVVDRAHGEELVLFLAVAMRDDDSDSFA